MNQILSRIYVQAAFATAKSIYPTKEEAIHQVALQLCMPNEAVEDALKLAEECGGLSEKARLARIDAKTSKVYSPEDSLLDPDENAIRVRVPEGFMRRLG